MLRVALRAEGVLSGVIVLALGAGGLMLVSGMVVSSALVGPLVSVAGLDLTVLLFAAIALVGLLVIARNANEEPTIVAPRARVRSRPPARPKVVLSPAERDILVLRKLSYKQSDGSIADETGLSKGRVRESVARLKEGGYVTKDRRLTDKGYDALTSDAERVAASPPI
jgi:biotin operon repressor